MTENSTHDAMTALSQSESAILTLIVEGLSNAEIAERHGLAPDAVKALVRSTYEKIGVEHRSEAITWALENGLSSPVQQRSLPDQLQDRWSREFS